MAKTELQAAYTTYHTAMEEADRRRQAKDFAGAISLALGACEHAEEMMKFARKYQQAEFESVPCVDLVLDLAPLIFDLEALDRLRVLLKENRGVDRWATDDLAARLEQAIAWMYKAHTLWDHIERNTGCRQDELRERLGGDQTQWRDLCETWERMGLLHRVPSRGSYLLEVVTDLDRECDATCAKCGSVSRAARLEFLAPRPCGSCMDLSPFVVTVRGPAANEE